MAEFCLDCWNKLNGTHYTPDQVWLEEDLCEGCGQWKPVVAAMRQVGVRGRLARIYHWLEWWADEQRSKRK